MFSRGNVWALSLRESKEVMEVRRWGGKRTEPASGDGQSRHHSPGCPVIEHLPADHWIAQ